MAHSKYVHNKDTVYRGRNKSRPSVVTVTYALKKLIKAKKQRKAHILKTLDYCVKNNHRVRVEGYRLYQFALAIFVSRGRHAFRRAFPLPTTQANLRQNNNHHDILATDLDFSRQLLSPEFMESCLRAVCPPQPGQRPDTDVVAFLRDLYVTEMIEENVKNNVVQNLPLKKSLDFYDGSQLVSRIASSGRRGASSGSFLTNAAVQMATAQTSLVRNEFVKNIEELVDIRFDKNKNMQKIRDTNAHDATRKKTALKKLTNRMEAVVFNFRKRNNQPPKTSPTATQQENTLDRNLVNAYKLLIMPPEDTWSPVTQTYPQKNLQYSINQNPALFLKVRLVLICSSSEVVSCIQRNIKICTNYLRTSYTIFLASPHSSPIQPLLMISYLASTDPNFGSGLRGVPKAVITVESLIPGYTCMDFDMVVSALSPSSSSTQGNLLHTRRDELRAADKKYIYEDAGLDFALMNKLCSNKATGTFLTNGVQAK